MENEQHIRDEILGLYSIFQLEANTAQKYDMSEDEEVAEALSMQKQ